MKQFTFSAQVANNLLTVLQGYSKTIRLLLVMFLTLTVSANAWAEEGNATITFSEAGLSNQQSVNGTSFDLGDYFTVTYARNGSSTNPTYYTSGTAIRCYVTKSTSNGNTITINQTENGKDVNAYITSVTYSGTNKQGTTSFTYSGTPTNSSNYSVAYSDASKVTSVVATLKETGGSKNGQFYSTGITITYTYTAGGGAPADPYTVTLVPGSGSVTNTELEEPNAGEGVTLPTPTLDCGDWEFAGWKTTSAVTTETTTEPTLIPAGNYKPSNNITLYAVYQRTETTSGGGGGGSTTELFSEDFSSITSGNSTSTSGSGSTWTKNSNFYSVSNAYQAGGAVRLGKSGEAGNLVTKQLTAAIGETLTISFKVKGWSTVEGDIQVSGNNSEFTQPSAIEYSPTMSGSFVTKTVSVVLTKANPCIKIATTAKRAFIDDIVITKTTSGGGGSSTTYYHSTPDCGSTELTYTLTLHSELSCAIDGSATVELNATELTNFTPATRDGFTCSGYWSAPSGGVKVLNADGTFAATSVHEYITDGKWTNEGNVTLTPRWECSNTMTLSVGTQSGGTYSLSKTSLETCDCTDNKRQVTITATPNSGYSVTDISYSGNGTATKVSGPTVNGNNTEWVYQFNQGDNGNGTFTVTFTTIPIYTITLDAGSGTCDDESLTETSGGAGVTLPTANPPAACATDGWEFAGWWTEAVAETTTSPGELLTAGSNYKPASDCTLHAVYSYTEAGGGGGSGFYLSVTKDATTYYIGEKVSGSYLSAVTDVNSAATFNIESNQYLYYGNKTYVSSTSNNTSLTIATTTPTVTWAITEEGETITFKSNGDGGRYLAFNYNSGSPRFSSYGSTYTYELTKHTTSTTTYNSNPTCLEPVWETNAATIDKTELTVNCGERSPMDGANGAAKITFPREKIKNFTKDITIEASEGFLVSTSRTLNENYQQSVSQSPLVGTEYPNTFNGKFVYVRAEAPAQSDTDLEGTITIKNNKGETLQTFSVTADVTCTQYTLTLDDRGTETTAAYYAGASVPEPEDPTGVCTDPINYVFDGWSLDPVTDENTTSYEKVTFPFDMPAGETTLYAVYRYVEDGGADSGDYVKVTSDLDDYSGDYLIVYEAGTVAFNGGLDELDETSNTIAVTINDNTIASNATTDAAKFTIAKVDGGYSIQSASGYYIGWGGEKNGLNTNSSYTVAYLNTISNDTICGKKGYLKFNETSGQERFRYYQSGQEDIALYRKAASYLYTTSPVCGPHLVITEGKEIYVTGGNAQAARDLVMAQQKVSYKATRLKTQDGSPEGTAPDVKVATNGITKGGVVTTEVKVTFENTVKELQPDDTYTITGDIVVTYEADANNMQEDIQVQLAVDYPANADARDNFTVHARSLPSEFVIVAKSGDKWYALNADMSSSKAQPANGQVTLNDLNNPTEATYAPCNAIYTFEAMPQGAEDRKSVRFIGMENKYLWAASEGNNGVQNYSTAPAADALAYNWKLYTEDNITYHFGNAQNTRMLGLHSTNVAFGMYANGASVVQDIRILPYVEKCLYNYAPTNLKVSVLKGTYVTLTWDAVVGATKYQYSTDATNWTDCGTEPTATINGLTGDTEYTYYIRAYHEDAGVTDECIDYAEITFTTANCDDVPTDITYSADMNSIIVSWIANAATSIVNLYSDEEAEVLVATQSVASPCTFTDLAKNTQYYVQILANGTCASPIIPVKTEDVEVDVVEWDPQGIIVDINTDEAVGVTLENEVSYGSGLGSLAEDLFFSKYFEGSGSLKMLAIYNGTGKDVNLSEYRIDRGSNGDAINISKTYDLSQLGIIKQGQEIIFYSWPLNTDEEASVYSCSQSFLDSKVQESGLDANPRWILCDAKTHNGIEFEAMNFSGNDPLLLYKSSELIDVFGVSTEQESPASTPICSGRSDEAWSADGVTNMDYGKTTEDFPNGEIPHGVNVDDETITAYTARVIMFRKNTVVSGKNAVTKNTTTFATFAEEWEARQVCMSGNDGDLTCAAYQELGTFDYSDYYTKYESMNQDKEFDENDRNADGTVTIPITDLYKYACSNIRVKLSNEGGEVLSDREYKVPIMITTDQETAYTDENKNRNAFYALQENLATVEVDGDGNPTGNKTNLTLEQVREICKTCDVVVRDNATLTKVTDGTENDHPQVHDVIVYEGASIVIPDGDNHNYTINSLSLRRKGDVVASAQVKGTGKFVLPADVPVTLSMRIDANNWHWFTLPYDCDIADVTWSDGTPAKYNTDWFLMYYDGESRAASTNPYDNHWKVYSGTTIEAGKGYIIGITGDLAHPNYTFELRFPMAQEVLTKEQENKTVALNAWGVKSDNTPNNKGWNLVGNPYLNYYKTADEYSLAGLPLIHYIDTDPVTGEWNYEYSGGVPYVVTPIDGGWYEYRQDLASDVQMMPFTAYFVQVGDPDTHENGQALNASFEASNRGKKSILRRAPSEVDDIEEPAIVAISLTNAKGESDKTTLLIADRFTNEYEMNADFFKWFGDYYKYYTKPVLYTIGADQGKRAFNALSEQLAAQPVALGLYAAQAGNYTFSLNQRAELYAVAEVWLHDANNNTYTNLMQEDYTTSIAKTDGAGRFSLSVKMRQKLPTDIENTKQGNIWATTQNDQIIVAGLAEDMQLWIYDATGKLLHADRTTNYQHSYSVSQTGTYFIRVQNTTNTQTIKVVVE